MHNSVPVLPRPRPGCRRAQPPRWLLVWILTLLAFLPHPLRAATTIRVGTYENEPLVFRNAQGVHSGVYIDILQYVAEKEGWTLE